MARTTAFCESDGDEWDQEQHDQCSHCDCPCHYGTGNTIEDVLPWLSR